jgi:hypothetical protein
VADVEGRLTDWNAIESRLHQDSLDRLRTLERTIEQEWTSLKAIHEEPVKQLREQAAALGETCVAAANLSLRGYERAEARLAALEIDLRTQLTDLSREVQATLAEMRRSGAGALPSAAPFPLEHVMRIHDDLRQTDGADAGPGAAANSVPADVEPAIVPRPAMKQLPAAAESLVERLNFLERELTNNKREARRAEAKTDTARRTSRIVAALLVLAVVAAGVLGWGLQQRLDDAATRAAAVERQATAAAAEADRELASARAETAALKEVAARAEFSSGVLTAPDLVRFSLVGAAGTASAAARGQAMWSRSRGFVLSTSRLPPVASGFAYHAWLTTPGAPVRMGELASDASGRATLVADSPDVPRPVDGVAVTIERAGTASAAPTGETVLSRPDIR